MTPLVSAALSAVGWTAAEEAFSDALRFTLADAGDDDAPFPFSGRGTTDRGGCFEVDLARPQQGFHGCGCPQEGRSPQYVEALSRLELLRSLADECGDEARVSAELGKRAITRALNGGVFMLPGGSFDCAELSERPTVGDVRLMLGAYAAEVGRLCHGANIDALVKRSSSPLEVERALVALPSRKAGAWSGLAVIVALGLGLALWWRARR